MTTSAAGGTYVLRFDLAPGLEITPPRLAAFRIAADRSAVRASTTRRMALDYETREVKADWFAVQDEATGYCWTLTHDEAVLMLWFLAAGILDD